MNLVNTFESQVREALNMTAEGSHNDWFTKWGKDYLLSLACALENEVCNNFKDKAVSNFGGILFNLIRDEMDTIFETPESLLDTIRELPQEVKRKDVLNEIR